MENEELDRLLAEYSTGGLSETDKKKLFTAALSDQELFDQLMEEDAIREAVELPGARNRLIDSLQEDLITAEKAMAAAPAGAPLLRMPSPAEPKPAPEPAPKPASPKSNWLAWAAGIGIVFVSGAITYMVPSLLDRGPTVKDIAKVVTGQDKDTKPFVEPPPPKAAAPKPIVEEPPKILADARKPAPIARPINIPLPSAPPPPAPAEPAIAAEKENKGPELSARARGERDRAVGAYRADEQPRQIAQAPPPPPSQQQQAPGSAPATVARRQASADTLSAGAGASAIGNVAKTGMVKAEEAREVKAKTVAAPPAVWRRGREGEWIRVPAEDTVNRTDVLVIRYTPAANTNIQLLDPAGRRLTAKSGRTGEELDLPIPATLLQRATQDSVTVSVTEGSRSTFFKILLRNP